MLLAVLPDVAETGAKPVGAPQRRKSSAHTGHRLQGRTGQREAGLCLRGGSGRAISVPCQTVPPCLSPNLCHPLDASFPGRPAMPALMCEGNLHLRSTRRQTGEECTTADASPDSATANLAFGRSRTNRGPVASQSTSRGSVSFEHAITPRSCKIRFNLPMVAPLRDPLADWISLSS